MKLCTFEVATHLGRHRRLGAYQDGRILDLNFAAAWYLAQTGECEPQRLADALVPSNMLDFLRAGVRAIHTAEDLVSAAGPRPANWWKLDTDAPRGPNDETLVYQPQQVRLRAPIPGRDTAGPEETIPAGQCRPGVGAVIGATGLVGFTLVNGSGGVRALGPHVAWPGELGAEFGAPPKLAMVARVNGITRGQSEFGSVETPKGMPGDVIALRNDVVVTVAPGDVIELEVKGIGVLRNGVG